MRDDIKRVRVDDIGFMADTIFFLKKSRDFAHDIRKETDYLARLCERVTCLLWTQQGTGETIRGEVATGVPAPGMAPSIPSRSGQPTEYAAIMSAMGIPEMWWNANDCVRPHYPGMSAYTTAILAKGGNIPPAFAALKLSPTYVVTSKKLKNVELSDLLTEPNTEGNYDG